MTNTCYIHPFLTRFTTFLLTLFSFCVLSTLSHRVVVVQEWEGSSLMNDQLSFSQCSYLNVYNYTLFHGYEYKLVEAMGNGPNLSPSWIKVFAIRELLKFENYDYVVFVDKRFFIQRPELSFAELTRKWDRFADAYIARDVEMTSLFKITLPNGDEATVDRSWRGDFQIWKNTEKNRELFERWMISTKREVIQSVWKTQAPYDMGSFVKDILPLMPEKRIFYKAIEFVGGMESEGFIEKSQARMLISSLSITIKIETLSAKIKSGSLFLNLSDSFKEFDLFPDCYLHETYVIKQENDENFQFRLSLDFAHQPFEQEVHQALPAFCQSEGTNTSECLSLISYIESSRKRKEEEIKAFLLHVFYRTFIKYNSNQNLWDLMFSGKLWTSWQVTRSIWILV